MLSLIPTLFILVVACGKGPAQEPAPAARAQIDFSASTLVLPPAGGESSVRVSASAQWEITTDGQSWYSVTSSPSVYKGESLLKVQAQPNTDGKERTGLLSFTCGEQTEHLSLAQSFFVPELSFASPEIVGAGDGGEETLSFSADATWKVREEDIDYWFTLSPKVITKGTGELTVTFYRSYVADKRQATLHFDCGSYVKTLLVTQLEGTPVEDGAYVPAGYTLVWQDDFSEASDKIVDNWRFENWAPGYVNNELQTYIPDDRRTAFTADGALNIVARKSGNQIISARMNSRQSWLYGYMEAAIWLPKGKGTWPAFWMMPDDFSQGWPACGEIDIMEEVGVNPNYTSSSIHCEAYNHVRGTQKTQERLTPGAESEYHVYALEWTADAIKTYVDGALLLQFSNDKAGNDKTWPFKKNFHIILNLAWGGDWGGMNGVDESALPCTMKVDYVRVYQK